MVIHNKEKSEQTSEAEKKGAAKKVKKRAKKAMVFLRSLHGRPEN